VYEITAQIGEGGMRQIFRARDTKLDRDVAIEILPEALAHNDERLARFMREATTLASLNHPHIASIYGLEASGGVAALVMELVEGDDLSQRIARGAIPIGDALRIAKQIADALEAGHEQGIIHCGLKSANIKVGEDGAVKVLDFGLAKAMEPAAGSSPNLSPSAALTTPAMMRARITLCTAAYVSPELAKGRALDKRSDVWAFGCVLYEMLTGRRAFEGDDVSDTFAAILRGEPDWDALPADVPPAIRALVARCLAKDRTQRMRDIGDVQLVLNGAFESLAQAEPPVVGRRTGLLTSNTGLLTSNLMAWSAAAVLFVASALLTAVLVLRGTPPSPATISFDVVPPPGGGLQIALSPDGKHLATQVRGDKGALALWIRSLDQVNGRILPGAEGSSFLFWSPDSRFIGFFAGGKLKKMELSGAPPQTLADAAGARGGTWNRDDVIVFAPGPGPLLRVSASGGTPTAVTALDASRQETSHEHPFFLPDGRHFLYLAVSAKPENSAIYVGALDSTDRKRLVSSGAKAACAPSGYLLFVRRGIEGSADGTLMAQRFDPARLALEGAPFPVVESVGINESNGAAGFAVSENGMLAHRSAGINGLAPLDRLIWFDRNGKSLSTLGEPGRYRNPRLSPDGTRVVVETTGDSPPNLDLSLLDSRGMATRFTFDPGPDVSAVWSPDGNRIAWVNGSAGSKILYQKALGNIGKEEKLAVEAGQWVIDDWLPVGDALLFHDGAAKGTLRGLRLLPLAGGSDGRTVGDTHAFVTHARVSADGRWVAFAGRDSGAFEIYVQNFPTPTGRWRVSTSGGIQPVWRRDGKELFYLAPDAKLMAVTLKLAQTVKLGTPVALFDTHVEGGGAQAGGFWHQYDVTPDGTRFLVNTLVEPAAGAAPAPVEPIIVIVNWAAALKK
jgi:serine/threonine protein kinase/Tol biopolymer transport system component